LILIDVFDAGLGMEIAKNIILGGVKVVTFHDPENVEIADLGSQVRGCLRLIAMIKYLFHDTHMQFNMIGYFTSCVQTKIRIYFYKKSVIGGNVMYLKKCQFDFYTRFTSDFDLHKKYAGLKLPASASLIS
jgi:hypothetical protein